MVSTITVVGHDEFRAIIQRVFRARATTMIEEAQRYSLADLEATLLQLRAEMREQLLGLPDAAFDAQPGNADGKPVWSAGQVIGHVRDAQMNTFLRACRRAAGLPSGPVAPSGGKNLEYDLQTRAQSLAILDESDRDVAQTIDALAGADLERLVEDEKMGLCGLRDMLLFLAIHDDDHLWQLRALA